MIYQHRGGMSIGVALRHLSCLVGHSSGRQHAPAQEFKACSSICGSLDHVQTIDMSFAHTIAVRQFHCRSNGRRFSLQSLRKRDQFVNAA